MFLSNHLFYLAILAIFPSWTLCHPTLSLSHHSSSDVEFNHSTIASPSPPTLDSICLSPLLSNHFHLFHLSAHD
tara:strand:+ start:603 stop:824 length:222 start_codon:yes stop_codon:yes gene_type:complete